jgi:tetratricopeptide (TPR) repeat protein
VNFLRNPAYRGLGWAQLRFMLTTTLMSHWIPLTWLTLGMDYAVWGMNPAGYHLTSLLLHAATAGALYAVARRLLERAGAAGAAARWGAVAAALAFALHPLRVESVAWVTERRDVLSGLLFVLTILAYLRAADAAAGRRRRWLGLAVALYALALLSKAVVMTLPAVLVVLDVYPLRRLGPSWRSWTSPAARPVWVETLPFALLGLAGAAIALAVALTHAAADVAPLARYGIATRVAFAAFSLAFYLLKTVAPLGLSPLYEMPVAPGALHPPFVLSAVAVVVITLVLWRLRRRWPAGLAAWVVYGILLAPMSGLVQAGNQLVADRYSYLPSLPLALLLGGGVAALVRAREGHVLRPPVRRAALAVAALGLAGLAVLSAVQVQVWRDTETLFRHALDLDPRCANCLNQLGIVESLRGRWELAAANFDRAAALRPDLPGIQGNLSVALLRSGRSAEAVRQLRSLLERYPDHPEVWNHLGAALIQEGKLEEARGYLIRAVDRTPSSPTALGNLGIALRRLERPAEAIPYLRRSLAIDPTAAVVRFELGRAYLAVGDAAAAREEAAALRRLDSALADRLSSSSGR